MKTIDIFVSEIETLVNLLETKTEDIDRIYTKKINDH